MKKLKQVRNIFLNFFIFIILAGTAFAISFLFGLLFVFGFFLSIYNKDIKKKPLKTIFIFVGGLITRYALGLVVTTLPNYELTLDFAVSAVMLIAILVLGWKIKRR